MKKKASTGIIQLGKNIQLIRSKWSENQADFGKLFKVTRAMVSSYETATAEPKIRFLIQLEEMSGISMYSLCIDPITSESIPEQPYPIGTKHYATTEDKSDSLMDEIEQEWKDVHTLLTDLVRRVQALEDSR